MFRNLTRFLPSPGTSHVLQAHPEGAQSNAGRLRVQTPNGEADQRATEARRLLARRGPSGEEDQLRPDRGGRSAGEQRNGALHQDARLETVGAADRGTTKGSVEVADLIQFQFSV